MKVHCSSQLFSLAITVLIMWQLMLPGYILTLDMVFGTEVVPLLQGKILSSLPLVYLREYLTIEVGGILVQKIFILVIFFGLFYLPLRYFKSIFGLQHTYGAEYVAALVFAINPFVYERFLAGQWQVLAGYALLVPFIAYALEFCRKPSSGVLVRLGVTLLCLGAVSIHYFMIAGILLAGLWFWTIVMKPERMRFLKHSAVLGLMVICGSSYWLVPALFGNASPLQTFTPEHYEVFRTATDPHVGVVGNVLALHGFWGEREPWIERFVVPKSFGASFWFAFIAILSLVAVGVYNGFKRVEWRMQTAALCTAFIVAVVLSAGVGGEGWMRTLNEWLFEHVSFWKGFRDTQKWSGVIALVYALFAGLGTYHILTCTLCEKYRRSVLMVCMSLPLICTPMMLFGFAGQLKVVEYPQSWAKVNETLQQDESCKALFLPWQQYYSLKFNHGLLTANVSASYFDCAIIHGKNMELGSIESQGGHGEEYEAIEKVVTDNYANPELVIEQLKYHHVKYIIFTDDVAYVDEYRYPFLVSSELNLLYNGDGIYLFELK